MKLLIATTNPGKLREFSQILGAGDIEISALSAYPKIPVVEETGRTFLANAILKAREYAKATKCWALADDSGLAVDALEGRPGVHSARWAEINHAGRGDAENNALLLRQLADVPDARRKARFICALALADERGRVILTASDSVQGAILRQPRGSNGFGYDPLFLVESLGKTTAELSPDQKHQISHRGRALRRLRAAMDRVGLGGGPRQIL